MVGDGEGCLGTGLASPTPSHEIPGRRSHSFSALLIPSQTCFPTTRSAACWEGEWGGGGWAEASLLVHPQRRGPGGEEGGGARGARRAQDPPIVKDLPVYLEEIFRGATKKMKITKNVFDPII